MRRCSNSSSFSLTMPSSVNSCPMNRFPATIVIRFRATKRSQNPAFLTRNPSKQDALARAKDRTQPEDGKTRALGQIIDFSPASPLTKDKGSNFVGTAQKVVGEFVRCILYRRRRFHVSSPLLSTGLARLRKPFPNGRWECRVEPGLRRRFDPNSPKWVTPPFVRPNLVGGTEGMRLLSFFGSPQVNFKMLLHPATTKGRKR